MNRFNRYADRLDVSLLKPLFTERGERRVYGRGEPFLTADHRLMLENGAEILV